MKQSKIKTYTPNYPRKLWKGTALAAAALMSIGATGCRAASNAAPVEQPVNEQPTALSTEEPGELVLDGEVGIDPGEEDLVLEGEPAVDENGDIIKDGEDRSNGREEPTLMGKIAVFEDPEEP